MSFETTLRGRESPMAITMQPSTPTNPMASKVGSHDLSLPNSSQANLSADVQIPPLTSTSEAPPTTPLRQPLNPGNSKSNINASNKLHYSVEDLLAVGQSGKLTPSDIELGQRADRVLLNIMNERDIATDRACQRTGPVIDRKKMGKDFENWKASKSASPDPARVKKSGSTDMPSKQPPTSTKAFQNETQSAVDDALIDQVTLHNAAKPEASPAQDRRQTSGEKKRRSFMTEIKRQIEASAFRKENARPSTKQERSRMPVAKEDWPGDRGFEWRNTGRPTTEEEMQPAASAEAEPPFASPGGLISTEHRVSSEPAPVMLADVNTTAIDANRGLESTETRSSIPPTGSESQTTKSSLPGPKRRQPPALVTNSDVLQEMQILSDITEEQKHAAQLLIEEEVRRMKAAGYVPASVRRMALTDLDEKTPGPSERVHTPEKYAAEHHIITKSEDKGQNFKYAIRQLGKTYPFSPPPSVQDTAEKEAAVGPKEKTPEKPRKPRLIDYQPSMSTLTLLDEPLLEEYAFDYTPLTPSPFKGVGK